MTEADDLRTLNLGLIVTLVEAVVFVVLGLVIDAVGDDPTLTQVFAVVSSVLVINRMISSYDLKREIAAGRAQVEKDVESQRLELQRVTHQLANLGKILDITDDSGVDEVVAIGRSYAAITNPRLLEVKESIARQTAAHLGRLHHEERTPVLDEADFYKWLYREFSEAKEHTVIRIVSMDEALEWTDTDEEHEFWRHNLEAAGRGVSITRIFVFAEGRLDEVRNNPAIYGHRQGSGTGVVGKVVNRARLEQLSPQAITEARQGFIVIDESQAIVDVFSADGQARGYATFNRGEVRNLRQLFDKFDAVARPLVLDEPRSLPPGTAELTAGEDGSPRLGGE